MEHKQALMKSVARARRAWDNHMRAIAYEIGIPDSYRSIIMYLTRKPGASQKDIAEFAHVTTSAINQTVKKMLVDDYLRKESEDCDKRYSKLFLTEKGMLASEKLRERLHISDERITEWITPQQEAEMIALLDKLTDYIRKDLPTC